MHDVVASVRGKNQESKAEMKCFQESSSKGDRNKCTQRSKDQIEVT